MVSPGNDGSDKQRRRILCKGFRKGRHRVMVCSLVYPFRVVKPTPEDCLTSNGKAVNHQKMYDDFHTVAWKTSWYAACGMRHSKGWSVVSTNYDRGDQQLWSILEFNPNRHYEHQSRTLQRPRLALLLELILNATRQASSSMRMFILQHA